MPSPIILPIATIQPSFPEVLRDVHEGLIPSDRFWISCYKSGESSVHAKARVELDGINRNLINVTMEGETEGRTVNIKPEADGLYAISCESLGIQGAKVYTPAQEYRDQERSNPQRPHQVTAFDVSPDGSQFATGFLDGSVLLYTTNSLPPRATDISSLGDRSSIIPPRPNDITVSSKSRRYSKPHASNITSLRFFPSSRVVLSASADFSLAILPADLPDASADPNTIGARIYPARVYRGHNRPISSTGIIGRGRNILSTSLDQTVKLWDVPSGSIISTLHAFTPITASTLGDRVPLPPHGDNQLTSPSDENSQSQRDEREVDDAQTKLVYCGLQNGTLQVFDLGSKQTVFKSPSPLLSGSEATDEGPRSRGSITAIAHDSSHHLLATASSAGVVKLYDTRFLDQPLTSFKRNEAGIEDLAFLLPQLPTSSPTNQTEQHIGLAIAANDGLPYHASVVPQGPGVIAEFIGPDCDAVRHVKVRGRDVWVVGGDSVVRRYVA